MQLQTLCRLLGLVTVFSMPLAGVRADAIYATLAGNLGAGSQTDWSVQFLPLDGTTFAQRFTTATLPAIGDGDGSGHILYSFSWNLLPAQGAYDPTHPNTYPDLDTTYVVNLLSDQSGSPGSSLLLSPATGVVTSPRVMSFFYADLVADPSIALQSNTAYWLTVAFQYASDPGVGMPLLLPLTTGSNQTGPGTIDNLMVNTGSGWGGISERAVVQVQVETVPEPATVVLVAAGAAIFGWRRLRSSR